MKKLVFYIEPLLRFQSACYKFNITKTHCKTDAKCWPYTGSNPVIIDNFSNALPSELYGQQI